jgi:hypothetical protein
MSDEMKKLLANTAYGVSNSEFFDSEFIDKDIKSAYGKYWKIDHKSIKLLQKTPTK